VNVTTNVVLIVLSFALSGCAALGITAVSLGASAFTSGAKEAVHAGTEYAKGGVVYRTFSLSLPELREALGDTLARMEVAVVKDEADEDERRIEGRAQQRELDIRLQPVTRTVTRLRMVISNGAFRKDRATASEVVAQLERTVEAREAISTATLSDRIRGGRRAAASSPEPVARR
jgi:hypothetical protein